jgi:ABC-2 type transport system ATP-binding protein
MNAIEAEGLVKTYPPDVRALDGVSFSVPEGVIFGLLGPNGAGKSTTVKILTTLSTPDSGSARVAGHDVLREAARVRRAIGVVAQNPGVDGELTGRENLVLQGRIHGLPGPELRRRADQLLEQFGLAEAADRVARGYSGGMKRRLDIAVALVHRPKVLFLDEPTTGLDPEVRVAMWEEISRLAREEGITILLTTHYLEEADELASQLAIVDRGRIVVQGSPEALKGELQGDAVHVELAEPAQNGDANGALDRLAEVHEVMVDGRMVRARVADGARAVPSVMAALESASIPVASVTVSRPSLDDVYLRYTGRAFAEADAEAGRDDDSEEENR